MGKSLFGQIKGMLSKQKKSQISVAAETPPTTSNLSRIGLATGNAPVQQMEPVAAAPAPQVQMTVTGMPQPSASMDQATPVGIQFYAEVPLQQSAEEIVNVSRRASNCQEALMSPTGDGAWQVSVTLKMLPVPQEIHTVESVLADWAGKLGGISKGWGLAQSRAA